MPRTQANTPRGKPRRSVRKTGAKSFRIVANNKALPTRRRAGGRQPKNRSQGRASPVNGCSVTITRPAVRELPVEKVENLIGENINQLTSVPLVINATNLKRVITSFVAEVSVALNKQSHDANVGKLYAYFWDAIYKYPRNGLYPKRLLDISAAMHSVPRQRIAYDVNYADIATVALPSFAVDGYRLFVKDTTPDASGYYGAADPSTTADYNTAQDLMNRVRGALKVVPCETYKSKHFGDPSVFATPILQSETTSYITFNAKCIETMCGLEVPIRTPWLAALQLFTPAATRRFRHTVQISSPPNAVVWALHHGYDKYAHLVNYKPISTYNLAYRFFKTVLAADATMTTVRTGIARNDMIYLFFLMVGQRAAKFGGALYGLENGSGGQAIITPFVGDYPNNSVAFTRIFQQVARSFRAIRESVYAGRLWIPAFTDPTLASVETIATNTGWDASPHIVTVVAPNANTLVFSNSHMSTNLKEWNALVPHYSQCARFESLVKDDEVPLPDIMAHTVWYNNSATVIVGFSSRGRLHDYSAELMMQLELPHHIDGSPEEARYYGEKYWYETNSVTSGDLLQSIVDNYFTQPGTMYGNVDPVDPQTALRSAEGGFSKDEENDNENELFARTSKSKSAKGLMKEFSLVGKPDVSRDVMKHLDPDQRRELAELLYKPKGNISNSIVSKQLAKVLPTYGKWGGLNYSAGGESPENLNWTAIQNAPPIDEEDAAYMMHDLAYDRSLDNEDVIAADTRLYEKLVQLSKTTKGISNTGHLAMKFFKSKIDAHRRNEYLGL